MIILKLAYTILTVFLFIRVVSAVPTSVLKHSAGSLNVPIRKTDGLIGRRLKRRGRAEIDLKHEYGTFYSSVLEIGTPSQEIPILFDTGSSDMWVASSANPYCAGGAETSSTIDCEALKTFNYNASSSFEQLDIGRFFIQYSDESFADGFWANEKMSLNGIDISALQFGVAEKATVPVGGVLGIGFPRRESVKGYEGAPNEFYPNFPQVLKNDGVINVAAYSLFLNEVSADSGSILFGAVDPTKYTGPMYTFPMVNEYPNVVDKPATLSMTLQALGAKSDNNCKFETFTTTKQPVLLDSGTTLMTAPPEIAEKMASFIGAIYNETEGIYYFECPSDDDDTEFAFDFGDLQITLPLESFVIPATDSEQCGFGLTPANYSMTLGAIFLSSAYVVYDLDNYQISIAQAKWDGNPSQKSRVHIAKDGSVSGVSQATAIPWTTDEAVRVDYDLFTSPSSCSVSKGDESSRNSSLVPTSMASQSSYNVTSLSLKVTATSTNEAPNSTEEKYAPTDRECRSIKQLNEGRTVTVFLTTTSFVTSNNLRACSA